MNPSSVLAIIGDALVGAFNANEKGSDVAVVRVPEGVLLLVRGGNHVLVRVDVARLDVVDNG